MNVAGEHPWPCVYGLRIELGERVRWFHQLPTCADDWWGVSEREAMCKALPDNVILENQQATSAAGGVMRGRLRWCEAWTAVAGARAW